MVQGMWKRRLAATIATLAALWVLTWLVVPPLVFRADGRGVHDLLTNSAAFEKRV